MRRLLVGLTAVAVLAVAAPALAQDAPIRPSLTVSPANAKRKSNKATVTFSGANWGAKLGADCNPVGLAATNTAAGGAAKSIGSIDADPPASTFKKKLTVKLAKGTYIVVATQACTNADGSDARPGSAQATLTIS
jgi:hypothetical protein